MNLGSADLSAVKNDDLPICEECGEPLFDPSLCYTLHINLDGETYMPRAPEGIVCKKCEQPYESLVLFRSEFEAKFWLKTVLESTENGRQIPFLKLDPDMVPNFEQVIYLPL